MSGSRLDQLDVSATHRSTTAVHGGCQDESCAWLHQHVTPGPVGELDGCPIGLMNPRNRVFVSVMSRTSTVLFHLPGHPVLLSVLGDFSSILESLNWWLEKGSEIVILVMYVAVICVFCAVLSHVFLVLSSLFLRHDPQTLSTIPRLGNTLAVATLVITIAGPLRTNTLGCRRISSRSPCAS